MHKQKTLASEFSLQGKGLHTGVKLTVTFNPALASSVHMICLSSSSSQVERMNRGSILKNKKNRVIKNVLLFKVQQTSDQRLIA